ncbi:hydrogenase maturation protease [Desulfobulbus alkaliphilus]|uniref:hydrogenase maturation protease n=1 Tax=Desulfobulbus alkaliphilus TaxID=869814 RepID=UPI0019634E0D|nr:hydrogenase maturation protease [Desulfobulbus alkaliphilus]MBM9538404.1 hydrogenase maturation protease [Desulfobulbus alkaliphilus]
MKKGRIICVGNRLLSADAVGMLVFDELRSRSLNKDIDLVEGGLGGLDLLPWFEGCSRIALVDRVVGFCPPDTVLRLELADMLTFCRQGYSHSGGLLYLLNSLPNLGLDPMPVVCLIGIEGAGSPQTVRKAAELALDFVLNT